MHHKTWLEISENNLINNFQQFANIVEPKTKIMAVVKSNAYGHGLIEVAKILLNLKDFNDRGWLGVDSIDEALQLRKEGINLPILILGYTLNSRLTEAIENNLRLTVYNPETIVALGQLSLNQKEKINIHIKVETGTARQGVLEENLLDFVKLIKQYPQINIEGLSTHFANIEDTTDHRYAEEQLAKFKGIIKLLENNNVNIPIKHTACSAATILFPETHFDMVRIGISLYGHWSSRETLLSAKEEGVSKLQLKPVLTWKTVVAQIKHLPAGAPIGYGLTEKTAHDSKIAILPIGYFDGLDRKLSSIGNVLINGQRCKILGRICMNITIVDVTHLKDVKVEDEVVLLGRQGEEEITVEEIAGKINSINYEVLARINPLIPRIIVK